MIKHSAAWMMMGNGIYAISQAAILAILARLVNVEAVGMFSFALAITAPIMLLSNIGLRTQIITDTQNCYSLSQYQKLRRLCSAVGASLCVAIAAVMSSTTELIIVVILVAFSKSAENQSELFYGVLQKQYKHRIVAISLAIRGILGAASLAAGTYYSGSIITGVICYTITWWVVCIFYDKKWTSRNITSTGNSEHTRYADLMPLVYAGLPLGISALLINLSIGIPRIFIGQSDGMHAIGIYSIMAFIVQTGSLVINSTGQAILPKLAVQFSQKDTKAFLTLTIKASLVVLLLSAFGTLGSFFFADYFLDLAFGSEVSSNAYLLTLMFAISPVQYLTSLLGYAISSTKRNISLVTVQALASLSALIASFILIPLYGLQGVVAATLFANSVALSGYIITLITALKSESPKTSQQLSEQTK
ncbi:oligosaccharide flippase family protein [Pseudomonas fluorescens]|jgi:O-antigen/teichoic acid export membrane protein|uniref:lipopolysaccharide biosynthesis protein n=1 Tax=Pseudomonas fluorescens TaxID=294 RepID=UPI002ACAD3E9|nr:oligosaccharide flippase family protein [Pseudomonas fluorescens]MDZ5436677.1 oligosaccharide flippase family protein [Pseudomonas fluorescens]